jgi:hypothetical protein
MNESNSIWRFILSALAVWRLTHLFAEEDGPWDLIVRLRAKLGDSIFGRLMDCFYCLSLWISIPMAIWLSSGWIGLFVYWQALSGAACLLERATSEPEPVFSRIEPIEGGTPCAVVKNESH